jgi:transcriptional regulator with XRE-family HTH domain
MTTPKPQPHGYYRAKARQWMVQAGAEADNAGALAAIAESYADRLGWDQETNTRPHGVIVAQDGTPLAIVTWHGGQPAAGYVSKLLIDIEPPETVLGCEAGGARHTLARLTGHNTALAKFSELCRGPAPKPHVDPISLKARRLGLGLNGPQMATCLGVSADLVSKLEHGARTPTPRQLGAIDRLEDLSQALSDRLAASATATGTIPAYTTQEAMWRAEPALDGLPVAFWQAAAAKARHPALHHGATQVEIVAVP